jgi:cytochrome c556
MQYFRGAVLLAAFTSLLVAGASRAHQPDLSNEMLVYVKRDGLMHLLYEQRYILQEMLVGKRELDQKEFVRAANSMAALFSMIPSAFEQDLMVDVSRAKPEIWQNWDDFVAKAELMQKMAAELAAMAEIHGAQAMLEKVRQFDCGICHNVYREK